MVYAIQVWGSASIGEINKILVLQKRALRIITHNDVFPSVPGPLYPTDPLFYKLEVLKIQLKIFQNWFRLNYTIHNHKTRSTFFDIDNEIISNNLFILNARTTHYGLKLLKVSGPKIWNLIPNHIRSTQSGCSFKRIPNHIRSTQSGCSFKRILKKHLLAQYI